MNYGSLWLDHLKTPVRTDLDAGRFSLTKIALHGVTALNIKKNSPVGTVIHANPAADAQGRIDPHDAALPQGNCPCRATFRTERSGALRADKLIDGRMNTEPAGESIL
jgi:hypothetical protein